MNLLREYRCWGGKVDENNPIYVWADCLDDAIHLARIRNKDLDCFQWTGREERIKNDKNAILRIITIIAFGLLFVFFICLG